MKSVLEYFHLVKLKSCPVGSTLPGSQPPFPGRHVLAGPGEPGLSTTRRTREAETSAGFLQPCEPGSVSVPEASPARESCQHGACCPRCSGAGPAAQQCQHRWALLTKPLVPWKWETQRIHCSALIIEAAKYTSAKNKSPVYITKNMYKYEYIFTCLFKRVVTRDIPVW